MVDKLYLAYIGGEGCCVPLCPKSWGPVTVHHVREYGSPKDDRRTIPLCKTHHLHDFGPFSIERLGKKKFQAFWKIDLEVLIVWYNARYEEGGP